MCPFGRNLSVSACIARIEGTLALCGDGGGGGGGGGDGVGIGERGG